MTDWVAASRRTKHYIRFASALWVAGVAAGSLGSRAQDAASIVSALCFFVLGLLSVGVIVWASWRNASRPVARAGWLVAGVGLLIALAGSPGWGVLTWFSWTSVGGADPWITVGHVITGLGIIAVASSSTSANDRGRTWLWALGVSVGVLSIMLAALLAPGPGVPYSVGPRDVHAVWRLLIDCGSILLPMAYAVLAQLRGPEGHRARAWLWVAAAALVFSMGDVGLALLDHANTSLYPRALWELGTIFIAGAASLTADFERAAHAGSAQQAASDAGEALGQPTPILP